MLLVSLRFLQGMALGGEWAGAVLLSLEHGDSRQRGRNASFAQMGPSIGTLIASGVIVLTDALTSEEEMLAWGWRVPLLLSVVLVLFGLWLRIGVTETPQFRDIEQRGARTRAPLGEVIRHHWRGLFLGAARASDRT